MAPFYVGTIGVDLLWQKGPLHFAKIFRCSIQEFETQFYIPDICNSETQDEGPYHAKNKLEVPIDNVYSDGGYFQN